MRRFCFSSPKAPRSPCFSDQYWCAFRRAQTKSSDCQRRQGNVAVDRFVWAKSKRQIRHAKLGSFQDCDSNVYLWTSWIFIGGPLRVNHPYGFRRRYEAPPAIAAWKLAACYDIILVFLGWNEGLLAVMIQVLKLGWLLTVNRLCKDKAIRQGKLAHHCWQIGREILYCLVASCFKWVIA